MTPAGRRAWKGRRVCVREETSRNGADQLFRQDRCSRDLRPPTRSNANGIRGTAGTGFSRE